MLLDIKIDGKYRVYFTNEAMNKAIALGLQGSDDFYTFKTEQSTSATSRDSYCTVVDMPFFNPLIQPNN